MDEATEELSGELAEMLAVANVVDPRTIPTRFSLLKKMSLSPAHYYESCQHPQDDSLVAQLANASTAQKRSDALRFGNACHAMLFGTGTVATFTGARRAGKEWTAFQKQAANDGHVEILNGRESALAQDLVDAIRSHPTAMRLLFDGTVVEKRIDWSWMGKACRSTPDAHLPNKHVVDLKTAVSSEPSTFRRNAFRMHYEAQAAFYGLALEESGLKMPSDYYIVAVEKTRPHPVTVLRFTHDAMELGAKQVRLWFERLLLCESANVWPPYVPNPAIADLDIDHWESDEGNVALEINGKSVRA